MRFLWHSLLFLWVHNFLLERVWLWEVDADLVGGDLVINLSHSIELVLNLLSVEGVKEESDVLLSVKCNSGWFSSDGCWVNLFNINLIIINNTISSRIAAWTAVRVLLLGLFWVLFLIAIHKIVKLTSSNKQVKKLIWRSLKNTYLSLRWWFW